MGDLTQISDNISINNPYNTVETLKLNNNCKTKDESYSSTFVNENSQINLKFPLPKVKVENNFPTNDKPLTSIMKDYILLTETKDKYAEDRHMYLEGKLDEERIRSKNKNKVKNIDSTNTDIIHLGSEKNIELNFTK